MEARFPTQDKVRAALIALLRAKGYERLDDCVDVRVASANGLPAYHVTPDSQAASLLARELANITGRALRPEQTWLLLLGEVNLLFGAVRERVSQRSH